MTCLDALCGGREDDQVVAAPDVRRGWIQYCREVVGDTGHHTACAKLGGSAATDGFPDDVRWPGYLGPRYAPQGLLWVANVHRNFDSAGFDRAFAPARRGGCSHLRSGR